MTRINNGTPIGIGVANRSSGSDNGESITGAQVRFLSFDGTIPHDSLFSGNAFVSSRVQLDKLRAMRRDPTIGLARQISVAPALRAPWIANPVYDEADPAWIDYVDRYIIPLRTKFVRSAMLGDVDFGWRGYEVIFEEVNDDVLGQRIIPKIKTLKTENTWQRKTEQGDFNGFLHNDVNKNQLFEIDVEHSLFINFDEEGTGDYGDPLLIRAEVPYDQWKATNEVANRFSEKVAGSLWVLHYPPGSSMFRGKIQDHDDIADTILSEIKASGKLKVPSKLGLNVEEEFEEMGLPGWKLELLETKNRLADFTPRLNYMDKLKARALNVLERTMLEGQFGTKAEAGEHADVMLLISMDRLGWALDQFNEQLVDYCMELNYDARGAVRVAHQPLSDEDRQRLSSILTQLLGNPAIAEQVVTQVSVPDFLESLEIPTLSEKEQQENLMSRINTFLNPHGITSNNDDDDNDGDDNDDDDIE